MSNNYIKDTVLDKKIILFDFCKEQNIINDIADKLTSINNFYIVFFVSDYNSFLKIMRNEVLKIINNEDFLICVITDINSHYFMKSLKFLIAKNINFRVLSHQDVFVFERLIYENYLATKGIDLTHEIIKINDFIFDNPFIKNITGSFEINNLILPSFFSDYSMVVEGSYEYGNVVVEKDDIVLDCGANIGSFSALALSKGGEVHAFEPIYGTFLLLCHYLRHYENSKLLYLNNTGLSNRKGKIDFYIKDDIGSNSYIRKDKYHEKLQCSVTTIDEYVKENKLPKVDFIKADIEGAERDMLNGAIETIKKYKPKISICTYHLKDDKQVIEDIIRSIYVKYNIIHKWNKCYAYV